MGQGALLHQTLPRTEAPSSCFRWLPRRGLGVVAGSGLCLPQLCLSSVYFSSRLPRRSSLAHAILDSLSHW